MRSFLRQRTAAVHARLDKAVGAFENAETYARYLRGTLAFREPIEAAVANLSIALPKGWQLTPLSSSIRADMRDLGVAEPKPAPPALDIQNMSALLGTLYVLEGSSLGAHILLQRARKLGFSGDFGARHLALQTRDSANWRGVLQLLDDHEPAQANATAQASLTVFALAVDAFTGQDGVQ